MNQQAILDILPGHVDGRRDMMIFGHFLEHFHRQIYGGVYDPGSHLADENGFRRDVIAALRKIKTPIIRWPGGCFVSAYPWKKGVGQRVPYYDKAWRVEEPNSFGTDEFLAFCREVGAAPFICTNAGAGALEDMADWVEYCNLEIGEWAALRRANGHDEPFNVRYWSIGNENYGAWEIGAKTADEWARLVLEAAKMMKRVDHEIELAIASIPDLDWNAKVLRAAGDLLDWISIHGYWSRASDQGVFEKGYDNLIARAFEPEERIVTVKHILGSLGYLGKLRIAFDEWNLRGWCHPNFMSFGPADRALMDANDINSNYNLADAVFTACFLNSCLRHCDVVGMANFSPVVNTVGAIFTHTGGIVLRPTYHAFDLFANHSYGEVLHSALKSPSFEVALADGGARSVQHLDAVATRDSASGALGITLVNLHGQDAISCRIRGLGGAEFDSAVLRTVNGESVESYNDVDQPDAVSISERPLTIDDMNDFSVDCPAHSVSLLNLF
ncbi:MAG: alpha-N-arabinofuranosidase [Chloroflexota bacterium]|nr:alpha-N-arabinofuranosidase [Chloroflexota bacterium]MDE2946478.1 alpha-N-arabinofuranosidase [Chloroflexota bacterium]